MPGDFVDLIAWQEAVALAGAVARLARKLRGPGALAVADQMRRADESVPANIAEGYGRYTGRDFARFLRVAAASAAELESHLRVAVVTERLEAPVVDPVVARCRRVRALIRGLRKAVEARTSPASAGRLTQS